jgi:hypothetical protein
MADKGNSVGRDLSSGDEPTTSRSSPPDGASSAPLNNSNRRRNKRKRKHPSTARPNENNEDTTATTSRNGSIFNGLVVALSALESKHDPKDEVATAVVNDTVDDPYQNYKMLKQLLQMLGATISPQVHKRVHYLISTDSAVKNLTQRVRQAIKRKVDVVDVAWVKECREKGKRVNVDKYLCNELVECLVAEKETRGRGSKKFCTSSDVVQVDGAGWSTPVDLDCCCVCHENGDDDCPWCTDCNITLARKVKAKVQTHTER